MLTAHFPKNLPDVALTTAFAILSFLATRIYLRYQTQRNFMSQNGFSVPSATYHPKEPFYGLDFRAKINKDVPFLYRHHQSHGKTFCAPTLIAPTAIMSIEPSNVRAANSGKDFGIQPARLPGMEPFCGRGFLTTDGDIWHHTRKLLKPGFSKINIADCGYLAQQVDDLLTRLPTGGATVDLQPLFYTMASCLHCLLQNSTTDRDCSVSKHIDVLSSRHRFDTGQPWRSTFTRHLHQSLS